MVEGFNGRDETCLKLLTQSVIHL